MSLVSELLQVDWKSFIATGKELETFEVTQDTGSNLGQHQGSQASGLGLDSVVSMVGSKPSSEITPVECALVNVVCRDGSHESSQVQGGVCCLVGENHHDLQGVSRELGDGEAQDALQGDQAGQDEDPPSELQKKFSKAALLELWINQAMPFYEIDPEQSDMERYHWDKNGMVVELERYLVEAEEAGVRGNYDDEEMSKPVPQCPDCSVPMMLRSNRVNLEQFWSCPMFPECRKTFSLEYWGRPAACALKMEAGQSSTPKKHAASKNQAKAKAAAAKQVMIESNEDMDGHMTRRAIKKPTSEASWEMTAAVPQSETTIHLSEEEMKLVMEARQNKTK